MLCTSLSSMWNAATRYASEMVSPSEFQKRRRLPRSRPSEKRYVCTEAGQATLPSHSLTYSTDVACNCPPCHQVTPENFSEVARTRSDCASYSSGGDLV